MSLSSMEITTFLQALYPFRSMALGDIRQLADKVHIVSLTNGQVLQPMNAPATTLYLCYSGNVELKRMGGNNQLERFGVIDPCEFFGLEATIGGQFYETESFALSQCTILAIHQQDLFPFFDEHPLVERFFAMLTDSYYPLLGMRLSWRQADEMVFWSSRKHPIFLWFKILLPILGGVMVLALYLFLLVSDLINPVSLSAIFAVLAAAIILPIVYIYLDWTDDFFVITDRRVISRNRVILLYETKEETSLDAVQSITKKIGSFWAARIGFGDIIIRTYTGHIDFEKIPDPDLVNDFLEDVRARRKQLHNVLDRQAKLDEMRRRLGYANPTGASQGTNNSPSEPATPADLSEGGFFSAINVFLQALFQLRSVNGDEVTYRTHWLILVKRALIPFLLSMACLVFLAVMVISAGFAELPFQPAFAGAAIGLVGIGSGIVAGYQYWDWRNDRYIVNNRQVIDLNQKPLGKEDRKAAPLSSIQSVEFKRIGLLGLIFNFGTVFIRIGDSLFTFDYVANPSAVQQEISRRLEFAREKERQTEIRREREAILDWIDVYHSITHPTNPPGGQDGG